MKGRNELVNEIVEELKAEYEELGWTFELVTQLFIPSALILEYTVRMNEGNEYAVDTYVHVRALAADRLRHTTIKTYTQWETR